MKVDDDFISSQSSTRIASVITHELAHNYGYSHKQNDAGSRYYSATVPEQVESCVLRNRPNRWPGPRTPPVNAANIVGMGVDGSNNYVFTWYRDGTVTAGSSRKTHEERIPQQYSLPPGKSPSDIVGMGIDGSNNKVFAWYRNGRVSSGSSRNLENNRSPYRYSVANGESPGTIRGMGIDGTNDFVFAWYEDATVSAGTTSNLVSRRSQQRITTGR